MLRYLTAGESHGELLMGIIEGMPSGLLIRVTDIDRDLARRQAGYGRGGRMKIEKDTVKIYTGVRWGQDARQPHRPHGPQQGLGELAGQDVAGPHVPELRRTGHTAPSGPRRPCRGS